MKKEDLQDFQLMRLANVNGKFAIQLGLGQMADALERALLNDWVRFIDIAPLLMRHEGDQNTLFRVFMLTEAGKARKRWLERWADESLEERKANG